MLASSVDVILLDLELPDGHGLSALHVLRVAAPDASIVVLTGRLDDSLAVAALADGADEVMRRQDLCELSVAAMLGAASVRRAERLPPALGTDSQRFLNDFDTPVAVVDGHGGITAVNRAWWLVGRDGDATLPRVAPGVNYLAVCDSSTGPGSEGAAEVARGLRAVLRGDLEECSVTYQCSTPDIERWFTAHITPLGEVGGGAIIAHLEVSQLHLVETSLRRGIRLLPTVLISEPEVFTVLGPDGSAHHVAARTAELLGLPDETWQAGFLARAHPADRASAEALLATAADSTGTGSAVVRLLAADDRWHVLDVSVLDRSSDPRVGGLVLSGTDITEQRQAEITRRLQGRLIDRLPTAVIVNDQVGVVHSWNQRAVELYGYSAAEAVGRLAQDLLQVSLEDLAAANRPEARHPERLHGELLALDVGGYPGPRDRVQRARRGSAGRHRTARADGGLRRDRRAWRRRRHPVPG
ncbi:MAG: PAS domain-containing protein [Sporichthyaceae bacterium]